MGNIRDGEILLPEQGCVDYVMPSLFLQKHDLLFNRTNSLELVGKVGLFRGEEADRLTFASYLVRLRVNHKADAIYLNYLLNSPGFLRAAQSLALPSINQANLNATRYGNITIAVAPVDRLWRTRRHCTGEKRATWSGVSKTAARTSSAQRSSRKAKKGNEELENWLMHSLHPQVNFKMHEWTDQGKSLVLFEIPRATHAPVRFGNEEFIRIGSYTKC